MMILLLLLLGMTACLPGLLETRVVEEEGLLAEVVEVEVEAPLLEEGAAVVIRPEVLARISWICSVKPMAIQAYRLTGP
jgi:hypothetical protein